MWPQQRQHEQYMSGGGIAESQQQNSQHHQIHPPIGPTPPQTSSTSQQIPDVRVIAGQHHRQQQTMSSHRQQQHHQQQQQHPSHHHQHQPHQQQQQSQQQHHCDNSMTLPVSSNPRASRNMAEKQRRDNLNTNISTMATLVPTVAGSPRRLDKISILRLAAAYLRTQYTLGSGTSGFLPRQYNDFDLEQYFVENLVGNGGFLLVVTTAGKIVYISRQVEQHLGHAQNDLFGQSLYNFVYTEDHEELTRNLTPDEPTNQLMITDASTTEDNSNSSDGSASTRNNDRLFREQRRSFNVRMSQRTVSRREHTQYECLHISGILRPAEACRKIDPSSGRTRTRDSGASSNDVVFVGMARLMKKRITELSLLEANKEEYVTRHLVDGRIIFCDHRISVVAGYMTQEVSGVSAFHYMHSEDVMWTIMGLRQMYNRGESFGSSCYRLRTKTGEFIYLRTHAYIEVDKDRQSFESFVCVNTWVSKEEGEKLVNDMKSRYSATISNNKSEDTMFACEDASTSGSDQQLATRKTGSENQSQWENAISHLISELPSPAVSEERLSPSPLPDTQIVKAALISQRLPPASIHASKIGIKSIDYSIPSVGKDKYQIIKQEKDVGSPASTHSQQHESEFEEPRNLGRVHSSPSRQAATTSPSVHRGDKVMPEYGSTTAVRQIALPSGTTCMNGGKDSNSLFHSKETVSNLRYASRGKDFCKIEASSSASSIVDDQSLIRESMDDNVASPSTTNVQSSSTLVMTHRGKPDSMLVYVKTEKMDMGHGETIEQQSNYSFKRSYSEDPASSKRRRNDRDDSFSREIAILDEIDPASNYYGSNEQSTFVQYAEDEMPNPAAVRCKVEQVQSFSNTAHHRDTSSPNSSLHDLAVDYQQINPGNLELAGYDDEHLSDFQDLQGDPLLSPSLDNNPGSRVVPSTTRTQVIRPENPAGANALKDHHLMKMFDDLRPVIGFEKPLDERSIQQLSDNDQAVNEGLRRTHLKLADRMTLQETQICVLERDLENPTLQAQLLKPRERLTELRAEQKKNTRLLKTIQQDHHSMQANVKHNIGV